MKLRYENENAENVTSISRRPTSQHDQKHTKHNATRLNKTNTFAARSYPIDRDHLIKKEQKKRENRKCDDDREEKSQLKKNPMYKMNVAIIDLPNVRENCAYLIVQRIVTIFSYYVV